MQPRTPPRQLSRRVDGHGANTISAADSDHSKQFDGQLSFSASNAGPHRSDRFVGAASLRRSRSLALDHR
ncbi:hypothetical protein A5765_12695 [Mycolicibacterium celeriflavum]|nr:hypothetical protein A5765_12695 [Mycolicibacterium celeriflavum]